MNQEDFEARVKELEDYARRHPGSYRLRVGLLAALGYGYIVFVLAVLIGLIVAIVYSSVSMRLSWLGNKAGWLLLAFAAFIVRSLQVQFPAPQGLELKRHDAPRLFEMVAEIGASLHAPRFHHLLLTDDFNAAIVQIPKLGILGWQRNYLVIGLPLMLALPPQQFRAVLAHEMGHLSGNHGRFSGWIYRVRMTWIQLLERLQQESHWGSFVFNSFVNWYAPFFNAYSFVLARTQEYEADRSAAEVAGAEAASEALINLEIKSRFLDEKFWPDIYKQADEKADPPAATFATMYHALRGAAAAAEAAPADATKWLTNALAAKTSYDDTHPCLCDRLAALGYLPAGSARDGDEAIRPPLPAPQAESAGQHFLGDAVLDYIKRLDSMWREHILPQWRERHRYALKTQQDLQQLEEKAQHEPLTDEERWDRARWTAEFKGEEAAIPLLEEILAAEPDHLGARFVLGQLLLSQGESRGIEHLERAGERAPELMFSACELIYQFLKKEGREEEAERYTERARQHYDMLVEAEQERQSASERDTFEPHYLPSADVESLQRQLAMYESIRTAYLARKVVHRLPEKPFYVLGIVTRHPWYATATGKKDGALVQQLVNLALPGHFCVIILSESRRKLKELLSNVDGARIYDS
jgi:Zn-dependent protease with chaperone function